MTSQSLKNMSRILIFCLPIWFCIMFLWLWAPLYVPFSLFASRFKPLHNFHPIVSVCVCFSFGTIFFVCHHMQMAQLTHNKHESSTVCDTCLTTYHRMTVHWICVYIFFLLVFRFRFYLHGSFNIFSYCRNRTANSSRENTCIWIGTFSSKTQEKRRHMNKLIQIHIHLATEQILSFQKKEKTPTGKLRAPCIRFSRLIWDCERARQEKWRTV